jgi:hypothetical protein
MGVVTVLQVVVRVRPQTLETELRPGKAGQQTSSAP